MMSSLLGRPDPDPDSGPGWDRRPEDRRDILREDREQRVRRRRLWYLWPGNLLVGKFGVAVLAVFLIGGLGWVLYSNVMSVLDHRVGLVSEGSSPHPESGRPLTAGEYSLAVSFGEPLRLGDGGLPVIRVPVTGDVREITPVEVDYDEPVPFVYSGYRNAVWGPGPKGWGIFWKDDSELRSLDPELRFTREAWRLKQEDELNRALARFSDGVGIASLADFDRWRPGVGMAVYQVSQEIGGWYPPVEYGHWGMVPDLWICDDAMESALTQGITLGCPDAEYLTSLADVWVSLGLVVEHLGTIGLFLHEMEGMDSSGRDTSGLSFSLPYQAQDMMRLLDRLDLAMDALWQVSATDDLPIFLEGP